MDKDIKVFLFAMLVHMDLKTWVRAFCYSCLTQGELLSPFCLPLLRMLFCLRVLSHCIIEFCY